MIVDPQYNPDNQSSITSETLLGPGVPMSKFLIQSAGGEQTFNDLAVTAKLQIAKNLVPQVEFISAINGRFNTFTDYRLNVIEGVYFPGVNETPSGINELKEDGRAVVYQLLDQEGNIHTAKSFDAAMFFCDFLEYDEVILAYDTFDPTGSLNCNIIITMPNIEDFSTISYRKAVSTYFNQTKVSDELLELTI